MGTIKRFNPLRQLVTSLLYEEIPPSTDWPEYVGDFPDSVVARYEEEISALEHMLGRDLSHWRASADVGRRTRPEMDSAAPPGQLGAPSGTRRPHWTGAVAYTDSNPLGSPVRGEPLGATHRRPPPNNGQNRYNWPWTK